MRTRLFLLIFLPVFFLATALKATEIPALPAAMSNNAVASIDVAGDTYLFSFMGLKGGVSHEHISRAAYRLRLGDSAWQRLDSVPVSRGRLAATAASAAGYVYLFGGYSVAASGAERSEAENFRLDPVMGTYSRIADMPVPVDDSVSLVYQDRFIYLISGWHDDNNQSLVQMYDAWNDSWSLATTYPGTPVFGHAGGIVGAQMVVIDGVAITGVRDGKRQFGTVSEGWLGQINPDNPLDIAWKRLPQLPGRGHYRMAGGGDPVAGLAIFVGGTDNAYNYNGTGYNGAASMPTAHSFAWDFNAQLWRLLPDRPIATMDHRGLVRAGNRWVTIGGMTRPEGKSKIPELTNRVLGLGQ